MNLQVLERLASEAGLHYLPVFERLWTSEQADGITDDDLSRFAMDIVRRCAEVCRGMHDEDRPEDYAYAVLAAFAYTANTKP